MSDRRRRVQPDPDRRSAMRSRLLARAQMSRREAGEFVTIRNGDGLWRRIVQGSRVKQFGYPGSRAALVEMEAGAALPKHRHREHEECLVLRGEVQLGDVHVKKGDYHLAPAGSLHTGIHSPTGALLFLRGAPIANLATMARSVASAWLLPSKGPVPLTVRADQGTWESRGAGVEVKQFGGAVAAGSALLRLRRGAVMPAHAHSLSEEFLIIEGEAFFGDLLLRAGEYQFAPAGSPQRAISSDVGAVLYRHGAREFSSP